MMTRFRMDSLEGRAELYATAIRERREPFPHCVDVIDCTKIAIYTPVGDGTLQRSVYSGHKRKHFLAYHTITTPYSMIFCFHVPEEVRDLTLPRDSEIQAVQEERIVINGVQYYMYAMRRTL